MKINAEEPNYLFDETLMGTQNKNVSINGGLAPTKRSKKRKRNKANQLARRAAVSFLSMISDINNKYGSSLTAETVLFDINKKYE